MASRALTVRRIILPALLALALALSASLALAPSAYAATKADVVAKVETLGLPQHLVGIGLGVAKAVDFDEATGDAIMGDIDRAVVLLAGRSIYELGAKDSAALIELCAASLMRVGVQTEYAFNPAGGADITLTKDGAVIAKFNTRDSGVVRTSGEAQPWGVLAAGALALALAAAVALSLRRGRRTAAAAVLSCMLAVPLALAAVPAFAAPAPAPVASVALTLTEPVAGQQASDALSANPQMAEAGLAWEHGEQPFTGAFVEGEEYTARISLVSDTPFSEGVTVTVNGQQVRPTLQPDYPNALQCSIAFTAKAALEPIDGPFQVWVTTPVAGEPFEFSPAAVALDGGHDARVSAEVSWADAQGASVGPGDLARAGESYTATVALRTAEGSCFGEGRVLLLFEDGAVVSETSIADSERGSRELSRSFSSVAFSPITGEIRAYVDDPRVVGTLPGTVEVTVDGEADPRLSAKVEWYEHDGVSGFGTPLSSGTPMRAEVTYTMYVKLYAADGWYFPEGRYASVFLRNGGSVYDEARTPPSSYGDTVTSVSMIIKGSLPAFGEELNAFFGGCTVVSLFGEDAPETEALRSFRDGTLSQSSLGRGLTSLYYEVAPHVTALLNDVPALKPAARAVLGWAAHAVA